MVKPSLASRILRPNLVVALRSLGEISPKSQYSRCHLKTVALAVYPPEGKVEPVSQASTVTAPVEALTAVTSPWAM